MAPDIAHCSLHIAHSGARFHTRRFMVPKRGQETVEASHEPSVRSPGFSRPVPPEGGTTNEGNRCREETSSHRTIVPLWTVHILLPAGLHPHLDNRMRTVYQGQVMDLNKFTEKAQAAVMEAQNMATRDQHQAVDVEHLALALLEQEGGLVSRLFEKAKASPDLLKARLIEELSRLPRVSGDTTAAPGLYVTQRLNKLLVKAQDEAKRLKDEYVSVEHLVLALFDEPASSPKRAS